MGEKTVSYRGTDHTPGRAMINVTGRCNSRCRYCRAWREDSGAEEPTREELLSLMEQIAAMKCTAVGFSGGEPLLRPDFEDIIARASSLGLMTGVVTNGLLLTKKRLESLALAGLGSLSVSLDSLDPKVYEGIRGVSLERVLPHIQAAVSLNLVPISLSTTVSQCNLKCLDKLVSFATKKNLMISFQLYERNVHLARSEDALIPSVHELQEAMEKLCHLKEEGAPITSSYEYLMTMSKYLEKGAWIGLDRCIAPKSEICVDEGFHVQTCWGLERQMGDLRAASLESIWNSDHFDLVRQELKACKQCALSCHFDNSLRHQNLKTSSCCKGL